MKKYRIPFNKAYLTGNELFYIKKAIEKGHISGDGFFTGKCQEVLERKLGVKKALLTTSCTHALEMAAILLDVRQGDEIIVPSFSFVSTVNSFVLRGAKPVFIDIRDDTLNMDERRLRSLITHRTKAVVPVHYGGIGCEMDEIMRIANSKNIAVVEDNAHGLFGKYKGRDLGSFGCLSALSFHETKNFTCGEGGALIVNGPKYIKRAEIIREKGTNRASFCRGEVDKYTWVDIGSSYLPSDILAAFLYAQLESSKKILERRRLIWARYYENLGKWAKAHDVRLPFIPAHCDQPYHMFYLILPSLKARDSFIAHLKDKGISSAFHYVPLHLSSMGLRMGSKISYCPVTEDISSRLVRLPFFNGLSEPEQSYVTNTIKKWNPRKKQLP